MLRAIESNATPGAARIRIVKHLKASRPLRRPAQPCREGTLAPLAKGRARDRWARRRCTWPGPGGSEEEVHRLHELPHVGQEARNGPETAVAHDLRGGVNGI